jgi:hypothetical protein
MSIELKHCVGALGFGGLILLLAGCTFSDKTIDVKLQGKWETYALEGDGKRTNIPGPVAGAWYQGGYEFSDTRMTIHHLFGDLSETSQHKGTLDRNPYTGVYTEAGQICGRAGDEHFEWPYELEGTNHLIVHYTTKEDVVEIYFCKKVEKFSWEAE